MSTNFSRKRSFHLIFVVGFLIFATDIFGQSPDSSEIIKDNNAVFGQSGIRHRDLYVYVDEKKFDLEKITSWMKEFSRKNTDPHILTITVFTDRDMLNKLIRADKGTGIAIDFTNDEVGRKAAAEYYEKKYPKPQGYFRVVYTRYARYEYIEYSPDKDSPTMRTNDLKSVQETK